MSFEPRFTVTHAITADLTRIERARGFLEAATLSDDWIREMSARALVLEAHHTTHIEGTMLTLEESQVLLAGEAVPGADPDDVRELLNYRGAFEFVSAWLGSGGPITEGLVREIHKRLVEGVRGGSADPGEYRRIQNYVVNTATGEVVYTPPPAYDVPILVRELIDWLNGERDIHPVLVGGIAQFQLVHIHPFLDGNGRASRLLSTLWDMDLTGWLEFFTAGLATQLDEVKGRGEETIRRDALVRQHALSLRQAAALGHVFEHGRLTIHDYERLCPETNRRTLQRDLRVLVGKQLLVEAGTGPTDPTRHYRLADGLVRSRPEL